MPKSAARLEATWLAQPPVVFGDRSHQPIWGAQSADRQRFASISHEGKRPRSHL